MTLSRIILVSVVLFGFCSVAVAQETPTPEAPTATPTSTPKPKKSKLEKVCGKIKKITSLPNRCYIYKNSAPNRAGGPGTPLIGYRQEPTLIGNCNGSLSRSGTTIYSKKGKILGTCPFTSAHGHYGRYRCTMPTAILRRMAVARTKKPEVYFSKGKKSCVKVPDAGKCYGSSKGLCNRVIK